MRSAGEIFCRNVIILKRINKLTQKEMAQILEVSVATIRRMEKGEVPRVHCRMLCRVCDRFGVSADLMLSTALEENMQV